MSPNTRQWSTNRERSAELSNKTTLMRGQESAEREIGPSSRYNDRGEARTTGDETSNAHQGKRKSIVIDGQRDIRSVAFLADGKHIVSRGDQKEIQRWRVKDGTAAGTMMKTENIIRSIAVAQDGEWIVGGTSQGAVEVWNAKTNERGSKLEGHGKSVVAVDVSLDGTRIATGANDKTACVWSRETGQRLLGPLQHDSDVVAVKFSPDARFVATATRNSVRAYDAENGRILVDVPVRVGSFTRNTSVAWASDNRLFALSLDGFIHCIDVSTGSTLTKWRIHDHQDARCIALVGNGAFIAASAGSSVSLWDVSTHEQVGSLIQHTHQVQSMATSDFDLVTCGDKSISLHSLYDTFPTHYLANYVRDAQKRVQELRARLTGSCQEDESLIQSLRAQAKVSSDRIVQLETVIQGLRNELSKSEGAGRERSETIKTLRLQETNANARIEDLMATVEDFRHQLAEQRAAGDRFDKIIDPIPSLEENSNNEIARLNRIIRLHEQTRELESMFCQDRLFDVAESLLALENTMNEDIKSNKFLSDWFIEFTQTCVEELESIGNKASAAERRGEAMEACVAILSLSPLPPNAVLTKWAHMVVVDHTTREVMSVAAKFKVSRFIICRAVCEVLEGEGRLTEAVDCFHQMKSELSEDTADDEQVKWECAFRERCVAKLVKLGDTASDTKKHQEAIGFYSDALLLEPADSSKILLKRSDELIEIDPSSYKGYEEKHAALHSMARYGEAFQAFQVMYSKVEQSPDPKIRDLRHQYLDITPLIQQAIQQTITPMPRVLINTTTGRLCDRTQQAAMFKERPIYDQLRSSMTTQAQLDHGRILDEVKNFYHYAMFSHRWETGEPLFHEVQNISVYVLQSSLPTIKLQTLCKITLALGFQWVWSDTCCIDKNNNVVLQESLVAMFSWYRGSSLTLIYLHDVSSRSQMAGDLRNSVWNTRVWTYQEYLAAETVRFYTQEWKPYLDLDIPNHKESLAIVAEMEQASGVSEQQSAVLRPGLDRVREKLFLASTRQTTLPEDIAYSLLGIFNASIPVIYGEGCDRAVGRLLEYVLTGSSDVSVLAWTGRAGGYNTCLPVDLTVYSQVVPPHVPQPIETCEMDDIVATLHASLSDTCAAVTLHSQLRKLPAPFMAASRLRLSGITFPITELACVESDAESKTHVYRATTLALGEVEIRTQDDLAGTEDLILIHPWLRLLFDQNLPRRIVGSNHVTHALHLVARLRQQFGALLLAPSGDMQYKRVAADSLIMTCIREETELTELIDSLDTIDIQ